MDYSGRVTRFLCADFLGVSSIHFFFLKWAPAIDHTGKTYYYEISTRQSVWELQDLDPAEGDEVITDTSANTDRTRSVSSMNAYLTASSTGETGQLDRTGHNDDFADDLDSWSSSGNESYSLSPPAVTAGPNGSVKQNITIRHKKSKTTDHSAKSGNAVRSNRLSTLSLGGNHVSTVQPLGSKTSVSREEDMNSQTDISDGRFNLRQIGKEHISGPEQNKLTVCTVKSFSISSKVYAVFINSLDI
ncbi:hypothetical protein FBUS_11294 [Fasciolopsis buskii]|uniref:WW domain-containing protein n=1 Tax=Fasciolopsis buskii TaxID=27845 RepID=A0A8E0VFJ9_9TREM|nr:hypothetical protein FBUS_11294 [Fasciolopsis buski]